MKHAEVKEEPDYVQDESDESGDENVNWFVIFFCILFISSPIQRKDNKSNCLHQITCWKNHRKNRIHCYFRSALLMIDATYAG